MAKAKLNVLVIGLGAFGSSVAENLVKLGHDVLGADTDPKVVEEIKERLTHVIQLDATDEAALRTVGVDEFDACVVGRGTDLSDSIQILMNLKELGAKRIVAKSLSAVQGKILEHLGVDEIVWPERDMGERFARKLTAGGDVRFFDFESPYCVEEIDVPKKFVDKTLRDLQVATKYNVVVLAITQNGRSVGSCPPTGTDVVPEGASIFVFGTDEAIEKLREAAG